MTPTPDQLAALAAFDTFLKNPGQPVFLLRGYAGTGKTYLLQALLAGLATQRRHAVLLAPTGRAARVMTRQTGRAAATVHRGIYDFTQLRRLALPGSQPGPRRDADKTFKYHFDLAANQAPVGTVFVVDEASMLGDAFSESEFFRLGSGQVLSDLLRYVQPTPRNGYKLLLVGDRAQLPPVGDRDSWGLDAPWLRERLALPADPPGVELTAVVRQQAGSGILANATAVRECLRTGQFAGLRLTRTPDVQDVPPGQLLPTYLKAGGGPAADDQAIIITYSNSLARHYNQQVRAHFFAGQAGLAVGDRLIITQNNYLDPLNAVYNGEFATVRAVSEPFGITRTVHVNKQPVQVPLRWRRVGLRLTRPDGSIYDTERLLLDMFLESADNALRAEQVRALYIDAIDRCRKQHGFDDRDERFKDFLRQDAQFNALRAKYGYAITCHKAQGGTWHTALVDFAGFSGQRHAHYFRWVYTALTRAARQLYLLNAPDFTPWEGMRVFDPAARPAAPAGVALWPEVRREQAARFDPLEELETRLGLGQRPAHEVRQFRQVAARLGELGVEIDGVSGQQNALRYALRRGPERGEVLAYYTKDAPFSKALPCGTTTPFKQEAAAQLNAPLPAGAEVVPVAFSPDEPPALAGFYEQFAEAAAGLGIVVLAVRMQRHCHHYQLQDDTGRAVLLLDYDKRGRITGARLDQHDSPALADKLHALLKNME
jgi:hypothetical protein